MAKSSSASGAINPYVEILQLDPEQCPPDHYALLGLPRYTSDHQQIEAAAAEQIRYVRPFCARYPSEGTELLNELTKAKLCLLDDEERAAYDARLRADEHPTATADIPATAETPADAALEPETFALAFGDQLDAMAESKADNRTRRCPHCGSGLFDGDTTCPSCTGGLAAGGPWMAAKCPECSKPLARGAVVCKMCRADLTITDVIGCIPPHVPGSIRPFECQQRKKLRGARQLAMLAWSQEAAGVVAQTDDTSEPKRKQGDKSSSSPADSESKKSKRRPVEESLPPLVTLLAKAAQGVAEQLGYEGDLAEEISQRFRIWRATIQGWNLQPGTVASYLALAAIPLAGLFVIWKIIDASDGLTTANVTRVAATASVRQGATPDAGPSETVESTEPTTSDDPPADSDATMSPAMTSAPTEPMPVETEGQRQLAALTQTTLELTQGDDRNTVDGVRAAVALIPRARQLKTQLANEATSKRDLEQIEQQLMSTATAWLSTVLRDARGSATDGAAHQAMLQLLNEPETLVLAEASNWYAVDDYVQDFVTDQARQELLSYCLAEKFAEAERFAGSVTVPQIIADYEDNLRSVLQQELQRQILNHGDRLRIRAIALAEELKIVEGLNELAKMKSEPLRDELSRHYAYYFQAFTDVVLRQVQTDWRKLKRSDLQAIADAAAADPELHKDQTILQFNERLTQVTFLLRVEKVATKRDAQDLMSGPTDRHALDEVVKILTQIKSRSESTLRRDVWYVVSFGSYRPREKFTQLYQAAAAVVLGAVALNEFRFSAAAVGSEAEADALLQGRGAVKMHAFSYPLK